MKILGIRYDNISVQEALTTALGFLDAEKKSEIYFLNANCLYKAQDDRDYAEILNSAQLVLPDGIGVRLITWLMGGHMKENCNGTDFSPLFLKEIAKKGRSVFFLGSADGIAQKAALALGRAVPEIRIVGTHGGYFEDNNSVISLINRSGADVLFVAMGVPLQEKWIDENRDKLNPKVCLGVGAMLDYLSGDLPRAPKFMRRIHMEWFWRMIVDPKRLIKRYLFDGSHLFWMVLKEKLSRKRS